MKYMNGYTPIAQFTYFSKVIFRNRQMIVYNSVFMREGGYLGISEN